MAKSTFSPDLSPEQEAGRQGDKQRTSAGAGAGAGAGEGVSTGSALLQPHGTNTRRFISLRRRACGAQAQSGWLSRAPGQNREQAKPAGLEGQPHV